MVGGTVSSRAAINRCRRGSGFSWPVDPLGGGLEGAAFLRFFLALAILIAGYTAALTPVENPG